MKRKVALSLIPVLVLGGISAQSVVIGEKVPDLKVKEWVSSGKPAPAAGKMLLIEFFHPSSSESVRRLAELSSLSRDYPAGLTVVVISKEDRPEVREILESYASQYHIGLDDAGRTFTAFGVHYLPYAVLTDPKGRLLWMGNSTTMGRDIIENNLENGIFKDRPLRKASQGGKR